MPSEQRLHPTVLLFDLGRQLKTFALPGLLLLFTSTRGSMSPLPGVPGVPDWSAWMLLLMLPGLILSVVRYASFRLRYDAHELVIAQGLWFRSERHVPYARIQNLDAVQSIVHRALGVAEVRIETGGGADAEASIRVLPLAAVDEMRRRVFEGRRLASTAAAGVAATDTTETADRDTGAALTAAPGVVLLRLALRDVLLYGLIESRGIVLIGAVYGALWEFGLVERAWNHVPGAGAFGRSAFLRLLDGAVGRAPFPLQLLWYGAVGLFAVVALVKLASMLWSAIRLYDFMVTRVGHDVRTQFGLFTRVTTHHSAPPRPDRHREPGATASAPRSGVASRRNGRQRTRGRRGERSAVARSSRRTGPRG